MVVEGDRHPVGGGPYVCFDVPVAEANCVLKCSPTVLDGALEAAAVGEGKWPRVVKERGSGAHPREGTRLMRLTWCTVLTVGNIELSFARLVPTLGGDGWLCRLPSAVVWAPGTGQGTAAFVAACLSANDPTDLLGRVGSRLADPRSEPWPPFAIVAARGDGLVAVVHGPVEVAVEQGGSDAKLYGGDDVGSWLNRQLRDVSALRAGVQAEGDPFADLREGVIRASGFLLAAPDSAGRPWAVASSGHPATGAPQEAASRDTGRRERAATEAARRAVPSYAQAESPTVAEPLLPEADFTVAEAPAGRREAVSPSQAVTLIQSAIGKLTWDNGEVHQLSGPALVGRDIAADDAVLSGELSPVVPSGQNDSMSRVHAELRVRDGELVVVDRGSTNGTFVWDEPAKAWQRLAAGEPHVVRTGTVLAFGERTATFESVS